jgi:predicted RNA binding protein YcfA (HicA-like mRNA interferase family)
MAERAMNRKKLLGRLSRGDVRNVAFRDMVNLVQGFGFRLDRIQGSHHVFRHPSIREMLNLQEVDAEAKPYQIRQFLRLVERHNLLLEQEP